MQNNPSANLLSNSLRVYRALLVAYPKTFRKNYEIHMVQVFQDSIREAYHQNQIFGLVDVWLHTIADLLVTAFMEHISERSKFMFSPKVILWGGIAGICGGLFWVLAAFQSSGPGPIELGLVLGLGGLVGLYSRHGGRLSLAGLVWGVLGTGLALADLWWASTSGNLSSMESDPILAAPAVLMLSLGMIILGVGLVLLGITSLRTENPHNWRGLPLGIGLLSLISGITFWLVFYVPMNQGRLPWDPWNFGMYVLFPAVHVLLGIGWMGTGVMLTAEADAKGALPPPASA